MKLYKQHMIFFCISILGCSVQKKSFGTQNTPAKDGWASVDFNNTLDTEETYGRECEMATMKPSSKSQKNVLRLAGREQCGQYYRLDKRKIEIKKELVVELENILDVPITISHACGLTNETVSVLVEGENDAWGSNTGYGVLDTGCVLFPGKFLKVVVDVKSGQNLRHYKAREASQMMKEGCYSARLALAGRISELSFDLCIAK